MPWHFHGIQHQENITKQEMSIVLIIDNKTRKLMSFEAQSRVKLKNVCLKLTEE